MRPSSRRVASSRCTRRARHVRGTRREMLRASGAARVVLVAVSSFVTAYARRTGAAAPQRRDDETRQSVARESSSSSRYRTFCGLQPHPGNGSPSSPMGHGASSPGTPWSPLSPLSPFRPFLPIGPCEKTRVTSSFVPGVTRVMVFVKRLQVAVALVARWCRHDKKTY